MRLSLIIDPEEYETYRHAMPTEARNHALAVILDSNRLKGWGNGKIEYMAALDSIHSVTSDLEVLKQFHQQTKDWMLGFITYDYKNHLEKLTSFNANHMPLPDLCFFRPRYLFIKDNNNFRLEFTQDTTIEEMERLLARLKNCNTSTQKHPSIIFEPLTTEESYRDRANQILNHIHRGDVYELNYCIGHFACPAAVDPAAAWLNLIEESPTPFSAWLKYHNYYTLSASPERYLLHQKGALISQPIKGTAARSTDPEKDMANKYLLANSEKERAENIMIADLVRNDLSRIAKKGSVKVDELCEIYGFRQVWQMITSISAQIEKPHHWTEALAATFPMGSMTGAPKIKAMQLIDNYENTKRGIYSGTIGFVDPSGNFDFNVVIRSLFYNEAEQYLSFMTGSAITAASNPTDEYNECLLKATAMLKIFNQQP